MPCYQTNLLLLVTIWNCTLNPSEATDFMLKPWVGVMCVTSSLARLFKIVVFPALSRPSSNILNSLSADCLNFLSIASSPIFGWFRQKSQERNYQSQKDRKNSNCEKEGYKFCIEAKKWKGVGPFGTVRLAAIVTLHKQHIITSIAFYYNLTRTSMPWDRYC